MPSLLYIGQNPVQGTGSPIILLRHLRRFAADGWDVRIVADYGVDYTEHITAGWTVIQVPHRRAWWPPYKDNSLFLRWVRLRLLAREIVAAQVSPPSVILSYLASHTDFASGLASHYARISRRPLHILVHDDATAFPMPIEAVMPLRRRQAAVLAPAQAAWFVSQELSECFPRMQNSRRHVILPLPEGEGNPAKWHSGRAELKLYYAGKVWPEQIPLLECCAKAFAAVGGQLVVIAEPSPELVLAAGRALINIIAPFEQNTAALEYIRNNATAVLVSYAKTVAEMPWSATSFPSKLVEYLHLGLPVVLIAPSETAVQHWAARVDFRPTFQPHEISVLTAWVKKLCNAENWNIASEVNLAIARANCDPVGIHRELDKALRTHTTIPRRQLERVLNFSGRES